MKYNVYVDMVFSTCIEVEADSREEAMDLAEREVSDDYLYHANWGTFLQAESTDCDEC